jgi:DNA-binding FadR family transcriptional regulator
VDSGPSKPTVARQIERTIACEILRGERRPGSRLPAVRALAVTFETTVPTLQRALDRLAALGLVRARRGSGVVVQDPARCGGLSLLPLRFTAYARDPEHSGRLLSDFLELRRALSGHVVRTAGDRVRHVLPELATVVLEVSRATSLKQIAELDAELTRIIVGAVGNMALVAVFETVGRLALENGEIAEAFYGDREAHSEVIMAVVSALGEPDPVEAARRVERAMEIWDQRAVASLVSLLSRARTLPQGSP